ncbi:Atrial natriuretic peptide receptor 2 [Nymphon striatum]|nr:Atrial natriuretic peptide receptor 2 [Nymphon striatum]
MSQPKRSSAMSEAYGSSLMSIDSVDQERLTEAGTGCCGTKTGMKTAGNDKKIHMIQVLLPFVPIMALIIQNCINMVNVVQYQRSMQETINQVKISTGLGNLTEALQSERAEIAFYLFTNGSVVRRNLSEHFEYTNSLISELEWPKFRINDKLYHSKILFQIRLDDFRDKISRFDAPSIDAGIEFYNRANYIFLDQLTREIKEKDSSGVWRPLLAYKNMIRAIEHLGISMVFGEQYFGRGSLDHSSYLSFIKNDALGYDFLNQSQNFEWWIKKRYIALQELYPWTANITRRRLEIIERVKVKPAFEKATEYFYVMLGYLDILQKIQYEIRHKIENTILAEVTASNSRVVVCIVILVIVLIISPVIIFVVRMVTKTIQAFYESLIFKTHELRFEKRRSDKLLFQMLPPRVAKELKQQRKVSAETFESATIYFSDIVGFAELSAESTPIQIISLLNGLYKIFDGKIDKYAVYKVETIGDAYMVAGDLGVPNTSDHPASKELPSVEQFIKDSSLDKKIFTSPIHKLMSCSSNGESSHAGEVAVMALDLLQATENFVIPHMPGVRLQLRIGMHTGPVVAGVVGKEVPRYCLFGETVDTASFMEASGTPFKIHITEATKEHLDKLGGFIVKLRGEIDMKSAGKINTYWLIGKHGVLDSIMSSSHQPLNDEIDVMAINPHTAARIRYNKFKKREENASIIPGFDYLKRIVQSGYKGETADRILSFHKFPLKDPELIQRWLRRLQRKNFVPTENSRLCSLHFDDSSFVLQTTDKNKKRAGARDFSQLSKRINLSLMILRSQNLENSFVVRKHSNDVSPLVSFTRRMIGRSFGDFAGEFLSALGHIYGEKQIRHLVYMKADTETPSIRFYAKTAVKVMEQLRDAVLTSTTTLFLTRIEDDTGVTVRRMKDMPTYNVLLGDILLGKELKEFETELSPKLEGIFAEENDLQIYFQQDAKTAPIAFIAKTAQEVLDRVREYKVTAKTKLLLSRTEGEKVTPTPPASKEALHDVPEKDSQETDNGMHNFSSLPR